MRHRCGLPAGVLCCLLAAWPAAGAVSNAAVAHTVARRYFSEGLAQVQERNYHQAIRSFRTATVYDDRLAEAYLNLGACYERLDQFAHGRQYYERALQLDADNPHLHYLYGTALARNGALAAAVPQLERAVYLAPGNVDYLYNLGVGYAALTQYAMSASCFEQVTGLVSNNNVVWYNLGVARLRIGQTNAAEQAFQQVELDAPIAAESHYQLGLLAYGRNDATGALRAAKMASALNPALWEADVLCAEAHQALKQYREASVLLERVYLLHATEELGHKLAALYKMWGAEARAKGDYRVALDRYRQAVRFVPGDAEAHVAVAECAVAAGDAAGAREALERARRHARSVAQEERIQVMAQALRALEAEKESATP